MNSVEDTEGVDFFQTVEEIRDEYQKLLVIVFDYDETLAENGNPYLKTIQRFQKVQQSIIHHSLFSVNEEFKELDTQILRYITLGKKTEAPSCDI